jgi:FkbM family methyltransferase
MFAALMPLFRSFAPHSCVRAAEWHGRFKRAGVRPQVAPRWTLSPAAREALLQSRFEHIPVNVRLGLKRVVDIGSNQGQWLKALLRFSDVPQIDAIEPNPDAFLKLQLNLGKHPGIRLHHCAVGDQRRSGQLNIPASSDLASLLDPTEALHEFYTLSETSKSIAVNIETLDDLLPDGDVIDLMKIDVQGFELPVLHGSRKCLSRTRALMIETNFVSHYIGDSTFSTLKTVLTTQFGFLLWDIAPPHRGPGGRALWADAIYVNAGHS